MRRSNARHEGSFQWRTTVADLGCLQLAAGLAEHEQLNMEVAAQSSSSASEAALLSQRCTALATQLASKEAQLAAAAENAENESDYFAAEISRSSKQIAELKVCGPYLADDHNSIGSCRNLLNNSA